MSNMALASDSFSDLRQELKQLTLEEALGSSMIGQRIRGLYLSDCFPSISANKGEVPLAGNVTAMDEILKGACRCIAKSRDYQHLLIKYYFKIRPVRRESLAAKSQRRKVADRHYEKGFRPILYRCLTKTYQNYSLTDVMGKYFYKSCLRIFDATKFYNFYIKKNRHVIKPYMIEEQKEKICACLIKQANFQYSLKDYLVSSYQMRFSHVPSTRVLVDRNRYDRTTYKVYGRCVKEYVKIKKDKED